MRWEAMFADLEAQADALEIAERAGEVEERLRSELGAITMLDRVRAAVGRPLRAWTLGGGVHSGAVTRFGPDWVLLEADGGGETVVRLAALTRIAGLGRASAVPGSLDVVTQRLGLWFVLRRIARDRSPVRMFLGDGTRLAATIDRVGADFAEVAVHDPAEGRRAAAVRERLLIPLPALAAVTRSG